MRSLCLLTVLVLLGTAAHAADLYVATSGSDADPGTQAKPFATIAKAASVATPGTTVYVAPGNYVGGIVSARNGTASARIRYVSQTQWGARINRGSQDAGWWNKGDYTDIIGFEIVGTAAPTWRMGLCLTGSHSTAIGNKIHGILTDPNAATTKLALSGKGGAGILADNYYGDVNISLIGNLIFHIGPSAPLQTKIHGIYQTATGRVTNNIVHHTSGCGITTWHDAHDIAITNNTIVAALNCGISVGAGGNGIGGNPISSRAGDYYTVANNIIVNSRYALVEFGKLGSHNRYLNNLSFGNPYGNKMVSGNVVGTILADPQFVNAGLNDYHLKPTSPAVDRAAPAFAPATDFDGVNRPQGGSSDLGAYERILSALPSGWSTADVGAVGKAGSTTWNNGTLTLTGAGADIWGTVDGFRFAYRSMAGDGQIVARVMSQTNSHPWAKTGVMIRETLAPGSRYAMCSLTPTNGAQFLRRLSPGGASAYTAGAAVRAPYWLKLVRVGTTFTAYQSANGTTWTSIGSANVPMGANVFVGLAVSSHDVNVLSTAVFNSVSVIAGPVGNG